MTVADLLFYGIPVIVLCLHAYHSYNTHRLRLHLEEKHQYEWGAFKKKKNALLGFEQTEGFSGAPTALFNFVWRSDEIFNDKIVDDYRKKLRRELWTVPLTVCLLMVVLFCLALAGLV